MYGAAFPRVHVVHQLFLNGTRIEMVSSCNAQLRGRSLFIVLRQILLLSCFEQFVDPSESRSPIDEPAYAE